MAGLTIQFTARSRTGASWSHGAGPSLLERSGSVERTLIAGPRQEPKHGRYQNKRRHVPRELRAGGCYIPILMLTARSREDDVLEGFEAGADDYLAKPFELKILQARVNGLLRRSRWAESGAKSNEPVEVNGKQIDFESQQIITGEKKSMLTLMEANLLQFLVRHEGQAVSRKQILESVWGVRQDTDTRAIDNFIVRLRRYLEDDPQAPKYLQTVRGVGYRLVQKLRNNEP